MYRRNRVDASDAAKDGCLERFPFGSIIATMFVVMGVILFCAMSYQAVNTSAEQARFLLGLSPNTLNQIQMTFLILGIGMALLAIVFCVVGFLSTGTTRKKTFKGVQAQLGGRISCAICICIAYLAQLLWLAILTLTIGACVTYMLFVSICRSNRIITNDQCVNLTILTPMLHQDNHQEQLVLCGGNVQQFCALSETASTWYYVSYFGAIIVLLGIVHFLICLVVNYTRIASARKQHELYEIWQLETRAPNANMYQYSSPPHISTHPVQRGVWR